MKGEDLAIYDGGEGEEVKEICIIPPHIGVSVLPQTLVVKAVNLCNLSRFVVSAKDGDSVWVADFESY